MERQPTRHIPTILGLNLRAARQEQGLSQHAVAQAVGTQAFQVSRWEMGRHRPKDEMLAALAEYFGRDIAWFYSESSPGTERAA